MVVNTRGLYYQPLSEALGVPRAAFALTSSLSTLASIVGQIFAGRILKKVDSRLLLSICMGLLSISFVIASFGNQIWQFYAIYTIQGLLTVLPLNLAPNVLISNWFEDRFGMVMGIAGGLSGLGGTVFNPLVSSFITNFGWRASYQITAVVLAVCILPFTILVLKYRPNEAKGEVAYGHGKVTKKATVKATDGLEMKQVLRTPTFALAVMVSVCLQFVAGLVQHVSGLEVARGLSLEQGALVVSGIMLGAFFGKTTIGMLLDRFKPELVVILYAIIGMSGWGLMGLAPNATVAVVSGVMAGIGQGVVLIALPWIVRQSFGPKSYGEILSVMGIFGSISSAVATTLHGVIFDVAGTYAPSLICDVILYIIATCLAVTAYRLRPFGKDNKNDATALAAQEA